LPAAAATQPATAADGEFRFRSGLGMRWQERTTYSAVTRRSVVGRRLIEDMALAVSLAASHRDL